MGLLDIIIVNYKSTDCLIHCLESFYDELDSLNVKCIVYDNSCDDEILRISKPYPNVLIERNETNIGFAAAVNRGIRQSQTRYVMLLNPDTRLQGYVLNSIISFMDQHPEVGILGPKILNEDGSIQGSARAFPSILTGIFGRTSLLSRLFPNNRMTRYNMMKNRIEGEKPVTVDWVSGACMVVRREAIDSIGLMDERFFMYWEDADFCKRIWDKGWEVVYFPAATVFHHVGKSSQRRLVRSNLDFHKSAYLLFSKYVSWPLNILKPLVFLMLATRFYYKLLKNAIKML